MHLLLTGRPDLNTSKKSRNLGLNVDLIQYLLVTPEGPAVPLSITVHENVRLLGEHDKRYNVPLRKEVTIIMSNRPVGPRQNLIHSKKKINKKYRYESSIRHMTTYNIS